MKHGALVVSPSIFFILLSLVGEVLSLSTPQFVIVLLQYLGHQPPMNGHYVKEILLYH